MHNPKISIRNLVVVLLSMSIFFVWMQAAEMITIDATKQKPISPYIYGSNFPDWKTLGVNVTVARQGGNRMTAYNWETNASNAGSDWYHQNDAHMGETNESGWAVRNFLEPAQQHNVAVILTVPCAGYVAADKKGDGDVNKTPDYLKVRFLKSYASKPGDHFIYPPDTTDNAVYQDEFVAWIEKIKSPKTPVWYALDNEPDIWSGTHARIHPNKITYTEIIKINTEYAAAIKKVASKTLIFGPVNYGWLGYRNLQDAPDANGPNFLEVYLSAMAQAEKQVGKRLLDVLDIHWYPEAQGDGVRVTNWGQDKPGTAAARIQAPRSLWDPTYVEQSWITKDVIPGKAIYALPQIFQQINTFYPGTKLAITEYNYGGENVISGAIAQADVLGIFGRYGIFAACNWILSTKAPAQIAGFNAYLNYDGKGSRFGDIGLEVNGETAASNSVYAALDSKNRNRLTIVAINKTDKESAMQIAVKGYIGNKVNAWGISSKDLSKPSRIPCEIKKGMVSFTAPALSVTTIEVNR
ncbi:MAG: glycoside hydrolase family 44 protein [bacterium]